jgi:hypothetical protein
MILNPYCTTLNFENIPLFKDGVSATMFRDIQSQGSVELHLHDELIKFLKSLGLTVSFFETGTRNF